VIRVAVMASSPMARAGLEALVRAEPRFSLLSAQPHVRGGSQTPDVLLREVASHERVLQTQPRARIADTADAVPMVLLMDHVERPQLRQLLYSGLRAILPRDADPAEIVAAIAAVAAGLTVLRSEDLDLLLPAQMDPGSEALVGEPLSPRETQVLARMAEGLGNKEIAAQLGISEHTVKFHVSSILGKLGAASRGEAVMRGVREGLIVI